MFRPALGSGEGAPRLSPDPDRGDRQLQQPTTPIERTVDGDVAVCVGVEPENAR
jgi:hypothetical protein